MTALTVAHSVWMDRWIRQHHRRQAAGGFERTFIGTKLRVVVLVTSAMMRRAGHVDSSNDYDEHNFEGEIVSLCCCAPRLVLE